jgi:hypothetical protein
VTAEAGSGAVSGEGTATPVTSAGTDANAVVTAEAGSGAVSGEGTATPVTSAGTDANAVVTAETGSGADPSGGAWADKIWFGHNLNKSSGADHHSNFDASDFDVSSAWTGVRDAAFEHGANALEGDDHSAYDAAFEGHHWDHGHTPAASDWLF